MISNILHSTIFRVFYFIPFAILKLITIVLTWYYENFINNDLMLQSSANRVIFVYLIPAAVVFVLYHILSANQGLGFRFLIASPVVFIFFPLFAIWLISWLISRTYNCSEDNICSKKERLFNNPPKDIKEIEDEGLRRGKIGEVILEYALKKVRGYNKVLTNLYIPINKTSDEFTEVDAVVVNKFGIFVWDAKYVKADCFYGRKNDDVWFKYNDYTYKTLVERELKTGESDPRVKKFRNPLKQNRNHVNAIQKQLRLNGFQNVQMFSGVAFAHMYEDKSYVECNTDETACLVDRVPRRMMLWSKMSKTHMSKMEIDEIFDFLSKYSNQSEEVQKAHIRRLQEKYGVQTEDDIDIDQFYITITCRKTAAMQ